MSVETELHEKIVIDGAEEAVSRLSKLAGAAKNVMHAFHGLGEIITVLGGIGGVVKIAETIRDTDQLYKAVARVSTMTGMAAGNVHAMFDQFELGGGIGQESAETIITALTRLKSEVARGDAGALQTAAVMNQLGVSVKNGPQAAIIGMAAAAEKGKVGVDALVRAFNIPRSQASQMLSMLSKGPEKLKGIADDTLKGAQLIDDKAIASYNNMVEARRELADAWGGIVGVLYKSLIPAVTEVLKAIKKGFDDIKPVADAVGAGLAKHMDTIVALAKTYLALIVAAKVANLATGESNSVLGWGKNLVNRGMGAMAGRGAKIASMDFFEARAAFPTASMFGTIGGPLTSVFSSLAGRLGIIGIAITAVIAAFYMLKENVFGVRDALQKSLGTVWDKLKDIGQQLIPILKQLWETIQPLVAALGGIVVLAILAFVGVLQGAVTMLDVIVQVLTTVASRLKAWGLTFNVGDIWKWLNDEDGIDSTTRAGEGADAPKGKNAVIQDFRGSHFEITNNFPQGIDGGRVAVAFGDELAALGERRLESGVRPLYSYR